MKKKKKLPIQLNEHKPKNIEFAYQKVVSVSQFQIYNQCPHKWANQYVRGLYKTPPNINMVFGTSIHNTFQHYLTEMFNVSAASADRIDIEEYFHLQLYEEYSKQYQSYKQHFSSPVEIREFFEDGKAILNWFKSHKRQYFNTKDSYLVGCEVPLQFEIKNNVVFKGAIDLVIYDQTLDKMLIYDIKTSTKGWNDWNKKDEGKISQILLYKKYFADLYGFPIDRIEVEFMILKRKIIPNEYIEFPKRIQTFKPSAGKIKIKQATDSFNDFVNFSFNSLGKPIEQEYPKKITKLCDYCPFNNTKNCIKD